MRLATLLAQSAPARWLCVGDGWAELEIETDALPEHYHRRGDASCIQQQQTTPLRNMSEQRFGREILFVPGRIAQMGNHLDSGLKGLLH